MWSPLRRPAELPLLRKSGRPLRRTSLVEAAAVQQPQPGRPSQGEPLHPSSPPGLPPPRQSPPKVPGGRLPLRGPCGSRLLPRGIRRAARRVIVILMAASGLASTQAPPVGHGGYSLRHIDIVLEVPLLVLVLLVGVVAPQVGHQAGFPVLRVVVGGPILLVMRQA